ncbi:hypothetical protein FA13DRAFT_1088137 [Coprinellus micaceus]|uniref:DNA replication regulator Sld3 C-terminal domain-containing protein n=1 Tax=Coprinellus micaceus TaxID=71717 RepID=A0A4Y7TRQ4_COPMI|nr:hypothetical protein FA13DRAFT_1088137 [Coprinellus micaceus]
MLYFLKLSLPAPPQTDKGKRRRRRSFSAEVTTEEYLEQFMDRLSMWQLLEAVQSTRGDKVEERDWMQSFCEEIVEPEFRNLLPNLCSLLRSKVFPHSPFSDTESDTSTTRASSPAEESQPASRGISRAPSQAKGFQPDARALARERSRSLSMSLAQEREQTTAAPTKKRMGTREISMSRIFKARSKPTTAATSGKPEHEPQPSQSQSRAKDVGVTLVEDTPAKPRDRTVSFSQTQAMYPSSRNLFTRQDSALSVATDNDDAWQISSSPDIMMLASPGKTDDDGDIRHGPYHTQSAIQSEGSGQRGEKVGPLPTIRSAWCFVPLSAFPSALPIPYTFEFIHEHPMLVDTLERCERTAHRVLSPLQFSHECSGNYRDHMVLPHLRRGKVLLTNGVFRCVIS